MVRDTFPALTQPLTVPKFLLIQQYAHIRGTSCLLTTKDFTKLISSWFCFASAKTGQFINDMTMVNIFHSSCSHFCICGVYIHTLQTSVKLCHHSLLLSTYFSPYHTYWKEMGTWQVHCALHHCTLGINACFPSTVLGV